MFCFCCQNDTNRLQISKQSCFAFSNTRKWFEKHFSWFYFDAKIAFWQLHNARKAKESIFQHEIHVNNFFQKTSFSWRVSAQTFLWVQTNISFAFPNVRAWPRKPNSRFDFGAKFDSLQPYELSEAENSLKWVILAWNPCEQLFSKNCIFLTCKRSNFSLSPN